VRQEIASPSSAACFSLSTLMSQGVRIVNCFSPDDDSRPPRDVHPIGDKRLLIQIPACMQRVRAADIALARAWREHTRALFEPAFAAGYTVVDFLFEEGRGCYLLIRDWGLA
jgi:predicted GNAT superfamily acetyltransferase